MGVFGVFDDDFDGGEGGDGIFVSIKTAEKIIGDARADFSLPNFLDHRFYSVLGENKVMRIAEKFFGRF